MSMNLQYSYAHIQPSTGLCDSCMTFSYEINHPEWITVPVSSDDYIGKFYNSATDLWYEDSGFTIEATEINEMYHG